MEQEIRTIIVGAGGIAQHHADALLKIPGVRIEAILDPKEENARKLAEKCGARVITRLEEALDKVQMIHLLCPPSKRLDYVRLAINAGKHIFCEKPIFSDMGEAIETAELVRTKGILFMTAFNMRFRRAYRLLQDDVLSGRLGDIISVYFCRIGPGSGFNKPLGDSWRTDPNLVCGMTIESISHDIDMIRGLGVEIEDVFGWVHGSKEELPIFDNNAQIIMGLSGGKSAMINASWAAHYPYSSRGVIGTKGSADFFGYGLFDFESYRIRTAEMAYEQIHQVLDYNDLWESFVWENEHFLDCIRNGSQPLTGIDKGVDALRVSLAILESAKKKEVVKIHRNGNGL